MLQAGPHEAVPRHDAHETHLRTRPVRLRALGKARVGESPGGRWDAQHLPGVDILVIEGLLEERHVPLLEHPHHLTELQGADEPRVLDVHLAQHALHGLEAHLVPEVPDGLGHLQRRQLPAAHVLLAEGRVDLLQLIVPHALALAVGQQEAPEGSEIQELLRDVSLLRRFGDGFGVPEVITQLLQNCWHLLLWQHTSLLGAVGFHGGPHDLELKLPDPLQHPQVLPLVQVSPVKGRLAQNAAQNIVLESIAEPAEGRGNVSVLEPVLGVEPPEDLEVQLVLAGGKTFP
mmetsp:Transcript_1997/g.4802  ORF Transcript_1997/g.4802 Transcript_1997/m.4802 type:complete len:288 (+) Transcript_1997:655-1518(+)